MPVIDWRDDSSGFAVWGHSLEDRLALCIAAVNADTAQWHPVAHFKSYLSADGSVNRVTAIEWLSDGQLAVRAHNPSEPDSVSQVSWWIVKGDHASPFAADDPRLPVERRIAAVNSQELEESQTGRLFVKDGAGKEQTIIPDLNPQLAEIEEPLSVRFEYQSVDGAKQFGELLLPYGYVAGTHYPTVVFVYGGRVNSDHGTPASRNDDSFLNLLLLAGHGYAVLLPSMPLPAEGSPSDPMLHLNDGVDPAIDKAVALGIVDPNRLAVMGHSYGAYSTYGLLTQTRRYKAGIGLMGPTDLVSAYGEFNPPFRFSDPNYAALLGPLGESGQLRMGVPPWVDPERYIRNSPVFSADKIQTPLMIVEGDLDFEGTQSERMFTALNRQGKRAEFVRYLGEQHGLESPANILDMWQRVFAWLDTYVKNAPAENAPK
jgi:dipeptidyl aminopeptidase/acylaminoacyl peptidase